LRVFGVQITEQLIRKYCFGTSDYWKGATIFWQVSKYGEAQEKVRGGKVMLYDPVTGKRSREKRHDPNWVHSILKLPEFALKQCYYGEHLLNELHKPVAIVESEKTAIISSAYLPKFIWIATGGICGAKWADADVCEVLRGRDVVMFPDLNAHKDWQRDSAKLASITKTFSISNLLFSRATEQEVKAGLDLADYLLQFPYQEFQNEVSQD
jgi:hypothetical protein